MTAVDVIWPARDPQFLARGYADCALLEQIMDRTIWTPPDAFGFVHHETRGDFPDVPGAVVVLNGRANEHDADWVIDQIDRLSWSLVIITVDEERVFPWWRLPETDTRKVWVMAPEPELAHLSYFIPGGWYPNTREELAPHHNLAMVRRNTWFFAGQVNHKRRTECVEAARPISGGKLIRTAGFLQGVPSAEYMTHLANSKVVPCPSGPIQVDTSRPLSALEAGCVPIVDMRKPNDPQFDYWSLVFGDHPLPAVYEWGELPRTMSEVLKTWGWESSRTYAWWQQWKRRTSRQLDVDISKVAGITKTAPDPNDRITVVITSSPILSHPDTSVIDEVIRSIREQLPSAEIIIGFDGVRPEQDNIRDRYERYVREMMWKCNFEYHNVLPVVLPTWGHQANVMRAVLPFVETDTLLFVEHDTPILGDIPWSGLIGMVKGGYANAVRLHQDIEIHPDHQRVMLDHQTQQINNVPARRTMAWWQRPHLASTEFYRETIEAFFPPDSRTMLEDRLYGPMWVDCITERNGWDKWKVWIYTPEGDIRRSGHLDGRQDAPKYDMIFGVTDA